LLDDVYVSAIKSLRLSSFKLLFTNTLIEFVIISIYQIEELKAILRVLSSEDFCIKTLEQYFDKLKEGKEQSTDTSKSSRLFGFKVNSINDPNEGHYDKELLRITLQKQLQNVIGNAALSDFELQEKKIFDLQTGMNVKEAASDSSLGDLEQVLGELQGNEGDTQNTVVKSRTGFI